MRVFLGIRTCSVLILVPKSCVYLDERVCPIESDAWVCVCGGYARVFSADADAWLCACVWRHACPMTQAKFECVYIEVAPNVHVPNPGGLRPNVKDHALSVQVGGWWRGPSRQ